MSIEVGSRPTTVATYPQPDYARELERAKENAISYSINNQNAIPPHLQNLQDRNFFTVLKATLVVLNIFLCTIDTQYDVVEFG